MEQTNNSNFVAEQKEPALFSQEYRTKWDNQANWYARFERYELPQIITCAEFTDLPHKTGAVIEVGCGPGLHSETLAKCFLRGGGSTLVSCDFSRAMVQLMQQRYAQSEFS